MQILDVLHKAVEKEASDILIVSGGPLCFKIGGNVLPEPGDRLFSADTDTLIRQIYDLEQRDISTLMQAGDDDFSFSVSGLGRFRCNAYKQRGSLAAVLRIVTFSFPDPAVLHIPETVLQLATRQKGLILVTGPAGSGKSTTLACMIDRINHTRRGHVITIEDPIEYLHSHHNCIVSQREIESDTRDYAAALRAALREAPDVILLGEMRDFDTIRTAVTAAETGQLVFSSLHTIGAAKTIDRIIDVFPSNQQQQIRVQLSMVLQAVVSQQLIPAAEGDSLVPAFEIMIVNDAIRTMIRESKVHQMENVIYAGAAQGMTTMDADIFRLYKAGSITAKDAVMYSVNMESMSKKLNV